MGFNSEFKVLILCFISVVLSPVWSIFVAKYIIPKKKKHNPTEEFCVACYIHVHQLGGFPVAACSFLALSAKSVLVFTVGWWTVH